MKIGILATGITPDELLDDFGSYADMLRELLLPEIADVSFETYDVRDGVFPVAAGDCDAWLITGSKFSAYEDLPWIHRLKALIRQIWESQRPMVGICFGHQIVAEALGGRVEQSANGWGVGLHRYQMAGPWQQSAGVPAALTLNAFHRDQVVVKPEAAEVVASSEFCPYAVLAYGDRILTIQAHPEFSLAYEYLLIALRKGQAIPDEEAEQGLATLRQARDSTDSAAVAAWLARFLTRSP